MDWKIRAALAASALVLAGQAAAQVTFYEGQGFRGRAFTANGPVANFERQGFNDRASSVVVDRGRWEVCEDAGYRGRCVVLRRGSYDSLARMGLNNRVSSVRPAAGGRRYSEAPAPLPAPTYEYRRRPNERVYEASVTSVHAVGGPAGHRCWIERDQVEPNVGGAVAGAVIGGILGHQLGSGRGRDVGTVGGAVAGAIIGSQVGGGGSGDVRRCDRAYPGRPDYWDVTYQFRGVEHRIQMGAPPGRTILVNGRGEPRG